MTNITDNKIKLPKTAVALGFFDGLHPGHMQVIKEVLSHSELASAVFTFHSDTALPKRTELGRIENLLTNEMKIQKLADAGIEYIYSPDFGSVQHMTAKEFTENILVQRLNAALVVCGFDFKLGCDGCSAKELSKICDNHGIKVKIIPAWSVDGKVVHSTAIKQLIKDGDIRLANKMLGYPFTISGEVIVGNRLGRTINSPTINQLYPENIVMPKWGVYKSATLVDGEWLPSVSNIGMKPTVNYKDAPLSETHILGYSGDLYGRIISVRLLDFIRSEQKFDSVDMLKAQLEKDKKAAAENSEK